MGSKPKLSTVVIARNEEEFITGCLRSVGWADEVLVVDTGSTDQTVGLSQNLGAKVIKADPKGSFADWRNLGKDQATGDWLLYLDADERVGSGLADEISKTIAKNQGQVYFLKRQNIFLGRQMRPDQVERLFRREALHRWEGELSEHPIYLGNPGVLKGWLVHLSHRDLTSMTTKTIAWSKIEAKLLVQANHPRLSWWRFPRVILGEAWRRLGREAYWRYGLAGVIEAVFQTFSVFITYLRLAELQGSAGGQQGRGEII